MIQLPLPSLDLCKVSKALSTLQVSVGWEQLTGAHLAPIPRQQELSWAYCTEAGMEALGQ